MTAHVRIDGEHASLILRDGLSVPMPPLCVSRIQLLQGVIHASGDANDYAAIPMSAHLLLKWMLHAAQATSSNSAEESRPMDTADCCQLLIVRSAHCPLPAV